MKKDKTMSASAPLSKHLSPLAVWALAFGASVGWGAFVMPGTTFLPEAGPLGTLIGLLIGAAVMAIIGVNYHVLINRYPSAGGAFSYAKELFGGDHGFLCGWLLLLTYSAIIWANATALSLIARCLFGNVFCFGMMYNIAGYPVYLGEVLLSTVIIVVCCGLCAYAKKVARRVQTVLAIVLVAGVVATFVALLIHKGSSLSFAPLFSSRDALPVQIFEIVIFAPWAFIGFESISHSAEEFRFSTKKSLRIMIAALAVGALSYILLSLIAASTHPDGYADWSAYISDLVHLDGVKNIPTFYAARESMGTAGLAILGVAAFAGIATGLIANFTAVSRLLHAMGKENMFPRFNKETDAQGVPSKALLAVGGVSLLIPLFGRTAIGWIVDVTTIGAAIVYAYTSASAYHLGRREKRRSTRIFGLIGFALSLMFALYYLLSNIWSRDELATESYLILALWSILGILFFRVRLQKDKRRSLGKSESVWIVLTFLILTVSLIWIKQYVTSEARDITSDLHIFNASHAVEAGLSPNSDFVLSTEEYISGRIQTFSNETIFSVVVQALLIAATFAVIFSIFTVIKKRERETEEEKLRAEAHSRAKSMFLSNMSHDIRTPMNAITGYTALALRDEDLPPKTKDYLMKIDGSSKHLLSLINDILDMSRIESGKVELEPENTDLTALTKELYDIFVMQCESKKLKFTVDCTVDHNRVLCDRGRLMRILLNLLSNSVKFTPSGGSISVTLTEKTEKAEKEDAGVYELRVKDTGIGMSKEFAEHVFKAFERERSKTVSGIQGTGLGMAITKGLVELMGGEISVNTAQNKGTEFVILLTFPFAEEVQSGAEESPEAVDLTGRTVLLVEDNPINMEIAEMILTGVGCVVEKAENGAVAVEAVKNAAPGYFDVVLMDFRMPVMNGLDASRAIRALPDERARTPIIAMTANAFAEDVQAAKDAGMNAHIAKPIELKEMLATISKTLAENKNGRKE